MKTRAFSTLAALACLLLLSTSVLGILAPMQQTSLWLGRASESLSFEQDARRDLVSLIESLERPGVSARSWVDRAAEFVAPDGKKAQLNDLSGRINLNGVTRFLLSDSRLSETFDQHSVDQWWTFRDSHGPLGTLEGYSAYFKKPSLAQLYTVVSRFNINTVDETVLEKVAGLRTGSSSVGTSLRTKLRQIREAKERITAEGLNQFLGPDRELLAPIFTATPELNVNSVPAQLLVALVSYPPWALPSAAQKVDAILSARQSTPLTADRLREILEVPETHAILGYLGTESWFADGRFSWGDKNYHFVLARVPSSGETLKFQILEQGWLKS